MMTQRHASRPSPAQAVITASIFIGLLISGSALCQESLNPASLQGKLRDSQGKAVADALVQLRREDTTETHSAKTDTEGAYRFNQLSGGTYNLRVSKVGYKDAELSVSLGREEAKMVDLLLSDQGASEPSATPTAQFFDQPQFTVAGVTDTTNVGGHASDASVRVRDNIAKDAASLSKSPAKVNADSALEKSLRKRIETAPQDFDANHQLGHILIASGQPGDAIPFLKRAAANKPADYDNAYDLTLADAALGNYAAAKDHATKLLVANDRPNLHHLLADIDEKLGDSLEAVRQYQRAAELEPTESYLFDWGSELLLHHAPEPAAEVFTRGHQLFPRSVRLLVGLGAASFARGSDSEAVSWICQASDLNPADPAPYLFLGKVELAESALPDELVEKLHRFLTIQPSADANFYFAVALWKRRKDPNDVKQAESLLDDAIRMEPKHAQAHLQLGILHSEQGAYAQAISDYQNALSADPHMADAHYRLAQAYRRVGQNDKAKAELRLYAQMTKESAQQLERERHEIKQFVYTLRDQPSGPVQ